MGTYAHHYKIVTSLFMALLMPLGAVAQEAALSPLKLNARYNIAWNGITLGRINITADESETAYSLIADTKTRGIAVVISDERSVALAQGSKRGPDSYIPARYESRPQEGGEARTTLLTYDADGNLASRTRTPDDDPSWRPVVPPAQINRAHDPITAAFMLRRTAYAALARNQQAVSTTTYDGARLAEMTFARTANMPMTVLGKEVDTIDLAVTRKPLNGYTPKELKKYKKGDPAIHLYFTNDAAFTPVRATAATPLGELSMTLVRTN
ncbi:MAG: DUF3108 domain-containing protein [Pseudomonadota bacterium]